MILWKDVNILGRATYRDSKQARNAVIRARCIFDMVRKLRGIYNHKVIVFSAQSFKQVIQNDYLANCDVTFCAIYRGE